MALSTDKDYFTAVKILPTSEGLMANTRCVKLLWEYVLAHKTP